MSALFPLPEFVPTADCASLIKIINKFFGLGQWDLDDQGFGSFQGSFQGICFPIGHIEDRCVMNLKYINVPWEKYLQVRIESPHHCNNRQADAILVLLKKIEKTISIAHEESCSKGQELPVSEDLLKELNSQKIPDVRYSCSWSCL